jgi:hypothetical protein
MCMLKSKLVGEERRNKYFVTAKLCYTRHALGAKINVKNSCQLLFSIHDGLHRIQGIMHEEAELKVSLDRSVMQVFSPAEDATCRITRADSSLLSGGCLLHLREPGLVSYCFKICTVL